MKKEKKLISIVVPCYNEEENIGETYRQLRLVTSKISSYRFEYIFVDNRSTDSTWQKIETIAKKDKQVIGMCLSRNFGPDASTLAGFRYAKGAAVIACACDLQDPIELIPQYIDTWKKGNDVVIGIYTKNDERPWMEWIRKIYYRIFKAIANMEVPVNSSGIALLSRTALDAYLLLKERFRSSVGLRAWIGFRTAYITYHRRKRFRGKSSYNLFRYLQAAERGFFGFSYVPLDSIIYVGFFVFSLSFLFLLCYLLAILAGVSSWNETVGIITVVILLGGIQLLAVSAIGKYIQVLVEETKKRPIYIVDHVIDRTQRISEQSLQTYD